MFFFFLYFLNNARPTRQTQVQSFISCYFCRRLLSRFLSRLRPVNTSHSLLVSSTNLSFSYVALSSFFSPRASPSPLSLFFSFKVLIVLSRTDRGNGRVIRSYLQKGKPSNTTDFISSFVIDCSYFSSFFFWSLQSSPLPLFLFFSPPQIPRRASIKVEEKKKKRKREITFDRSFFPVVSIIPWSFRICF